jgi:hypothetical protein
VSLESSSETKDDEVTAPHGNFRIVGTQKRRRKAPKNKKRREESATEGSLSRTYQTLRIKLEF